MSQKPAQAAVANAVPIFLLAVALRSRTRNIGCSTR